MEATKTQIKPSLMFNYLGLSGLCPAICSSQAPLENAAGQVNPKSKGLFQAAIMESGTVDVSFFFQPLVQAKAYYEDLASRRLAMNPPLSAGAAADPTIQ